MRVLNQLRHIGDDVTAIIALANHRKEAYAMVGKTCAIGAWNGTKSVIDTEFSMRETEENKSFMKDYLHPSTEYNYPTELSRIFDEVFLKDIKLQRYFLTIIVSKSGKGKSSVMNALGPHMYFREIMSYPYGLMNRIGRTIRLLFINIRRW